MLSFSHTTDKLINILLDFLVSTIKAIFQVFRIYYFFKRSVRTPIKQVLRKIDNKNHRRKPQNVSSNPPKIFKSTCLHITSNCLSCLYEKYRKQPVHCPELSRIFAYFCLLYIPMHCRRHCPWTTGRLRREDYFEINGECHSHRVCRARKYGYRGEPSFAHLSFLDIEKSRALEREILETILRNCNYFAEHLSSSFRSRRYTKYNEDNSIDYATEDLHELAQLNTMNRMARMAQRCFNGLKNDNVNIRARKDIHKLDLIVKKEDHRGGISGNVSSQSVQSNICEKCKGFILKGKRFEVGMVSIRTAGHCCRCEEDLTPILPTKINENISNMTTTMEELTATEVPPLNKIEDKTTSPEKREVSVADAASAIASHGFTWLETAERFSENKSPVICAPKRSKESDVALITLKCSPQRQFGPDGLNPFKFDVSDNHLTPLFYAEGKELLKMRLQLSRFTMFHIFDRILQLRDQQLVLAIPPTKSERLTAEKKDEMRRRFDGRFPCLLREQRSFDFTPFSSPLLDERTDIIGDKSKQRDGEFFWGKIALRGRRPKMEDEMTIYPCYGDILPAHLRNFSSFFGIYDGHHGRAAPNFCKRFLHINTAYFANQNESLPKSISLAYKTTEMEFIRGAEQSGDLSGCTSISLLLNAREGRGIIANLGDSRAIICRSGAYYDLTSDHTPNNKDEHDRVINDGGIVEDGRVGGSLAVSRAFGDLDSDGNKPQGLSATPDVVEFPLGDDFEFILIGCDGCWELGTSEELGREARRLLRLRGCPQMAAEELVKGLLTRQGATDNLTLIIIALRKVSQTTGKKFFAREPRLRKVFFSTPSLKIDEESANFGRYNCSRKPAFSRCFSLGNGKIVL